MAFGLNPRVVNDMFLYVEALFASDELLLFRLGQVAGYGQQHELADSVGQGTAEADDLPVGLGSCFDME